jgi:hypothetical protein
MKRRAASWFWITTLALAAVAGAWATVREDETMNESGWDNFSDTWVATDGLGRTLPDHEEVGGPRENRWVGIFYFLWLGQHGTTGPHDITKILAEDPGGMQKPESPLWGPRKAYHHWGEPLFGYYLSDDAWVLRKHAQMLADAGVDTVIFDVTNHFTYRENYMALLRVWEDVRREGGRTPQVAFLTPFATPARVVEELFEDLYGARLFEDLWFRWEGKPLILGDPAGVDVKYHEFFTWRSPEPSYFVPPRQPRMWSWLQVYPQHVFYKDDPQVPEQMAVGVGQNAQGERLSAFSETNTRGRSFSHRSGHPGDMSRTNFGINFAEQFERALEIDPPFIFITGWNEWVAMRLSSFNNVSEPVMFVDVFNEEYTRDIEPVNGFSRDHYYYQMVDYIRRYKGVRKPEPVSGPKTIYIEGGFEQWHDVRPEFRDDIGDTMHRDHPGWGDAGPMSNETGRNDFVLMKVARDRENVYFYVRTRGPITPHTDNHWMWLLINSDSDSMSGWEGYNFILNRRVAGDSRTWLEVSAGGWNWFPVAEVDYRVSENEMHLAIPRAHLWRAAPDGEGPIAFTFKWADNLRGSGDVLDFLVDGDVAPNGRFNYRFAEEPPDAGED